jgi:hypothetical protein
MFVIGIRCCIALQPCTAAQRLQGLPNIPCVCVFLVFYRLPRYRTRPAPAPIAVSASEDRRRTMTRRRAPQRHIPRYSFRMTRAAHTDQASSTCSSPMTRLIPTERQKVTSRTANDRVPILRDIAVACPRITLEATLFG